MKGHKGWSARSLVYAARHCKRYERDEHGWLALHHVVGLADVLEAEKTIQRESRLELQRSNGTTYFRALQGHSILPSEDDAKFFEPVDTTQRDQLECIHFTTKKAARSILESYFISPMSRTHMHFLSTPRGTIRDSLKCCNSVGFVFPMNLGDVEFWRSKSGVVLSRGIRRKFPLGLCCAILLRDNGVWTRHEINNKVDFDLIK